MKFFQKIRCSNGRRKILLLGKKILSYKGKASKGKRTKSLELLLTSDLIANKDIYYNIDKPRLLSNLDPESYRIIMTVLNKYEYLSNGGSDDLLETSEQIRYKNTVVQSFFNSIQELDNGTYKYKDFVLPIRHFETSVFLDEHGLNKINKNLDDSTIIDVGSFIADSILIFRKHFPDNHIIGFEATTCNYNMALQTLMLNNIKNAIVEKLALGDKEGTLTISTDRGSGNSCVSSYLSESNERCKMDTLDNYVKKHKIKKVGLIKVDIEGAEQLFIQGALETINRDRPIILMSIYHNYDDLMHIKPYLESLNLGYTFKIHKPIDTLVSEILLICIPESLE